MENFLELLRYFIGKKVSIFLALIISFLFGLYYTYTLTPKYLTSIIITENSDEKGLENQSLVSFALGQNMNVSKFFYQLQEVMLSLKATEYLNENNIMLRDFFADQYQADSDTFLPIWNFNNYLQAIKFKFLRIDYDPVPDIYLLNEILKSEIIFLYDDYSELIEIQIIANNFKRSEKVLASLISITDNIYKTTDQESITQRIQFIESEIRETTSLSRREALTRILENELLKLTLINTNSEYKIKVITEIASSKYPVSPNLLFNAILFIMFGLFSSLAYHALIFIKRNFFHSLDISQ